MRVAVLISFYNESRIVKKTIESIKKHSNKHIIVTVQSKCNNINIEDLDYIQNNSHNILLPNLAGNINPKALPSAAVCRNYSAAFEKLYSLNTNVDFIIAILGDTFIYDFELLLGKLNAELVNKKAGVLQAIGAMFHSFDANPPHKKGGRPQREGTTDIMPQFFVLKNIVGFRNIQNFNPWTTEENLGHELCKYVDFKKDVVRLNKDSTKPYAFDFGVKLQYNGK